MSLSLRSPRTGTVWAVMLIMLWPWVCGYCAGSPAPASAPHVTVADRLREYGPAVRSRLKPLFARQRISYPPPGNTVILEKDRS